MGRLLALFTFVATGAALFALPGCSAGTEEDVEQGESNLTGDEGQLAALRRAVQDVDEEHVVLSDSVKAPRISAASGATPTDGASLYGIDWYQKWAGGLSADHDWDNGSELGKRCMWASVMRFEAIMKDPPAELSEYLSEYTKWDGSFYNWNDDYSGESKEGKPAFGDAKGARIWAWRTDLSKWISATAKDGSCYLPTRKMLVDFVTTCKAHAADNDGEMKGCEVYGE